MSNRTPPRIAAGIAALALLVVAAFGLVAFVWGAAYVSEPADPLALDGDPCCGHPDTWGDVVAAAGWTLAVAAVTGLVVCAAVSLLVYTVHGRPPRWRRGLFRRSAGRLRPGDEPGHLNADMRRADRRGLVGAARRGRRRVGL